MTEKAREYLDTLVRMLENKVRCAEFHKQMLGRMAWHPRKDGKPRAELKDNFGEYPLLDYVDIFTDISLDETEVGVRFYEMSSYQAEHFGFKGAVISNYYKLPNTIHVGSVKELYDVVQSQIPKVIGQYIRTVKKEIESVKHGKFRKMFLAMVDATDAYRKEYHDFDKHKVVANCVVGTSSYQIFSYT